MPPTTQASPPSSPLRPPSRPPSRSPSTTPPSRRRRALLIGLAAIPVILITALIFAIPPIAENKIVELLEAQTGAQAQVEKIRFNPLTLRAELEGFRLTEPGAAEPAIAFDFAALDARWLGFLNSDVELDALILRGPVVRIEVDERGEVNLAKLFASKTEEDSEPQNPEAENSDTPLALKIRALTIEEGHLLFRDKQRNPVFELPIEPVALSATSISTRIGEEGEYALQLPMGDATVLSWAGSFGISPLKSRGELRLENFDLRWVAAYLAEQLNFDLASGEVDLQTAYELEMREHLSFSLDQAKVVFKSVSMLDPEQGAEFLGVEEVEFGAIEARVGERGLESVAIGSVLGNGGRVATVREKDETIRLIELLTPVATRGGISEGAGSDSQQNRETVATESTVVAGVTEVAHVVDAAIGGDEGEADGVAPKIAVDQIRFQDFKVRFEDRVPNAPTTLALDELLVEIKGYRSPESPPVDIQMASRVGKEGRLKVTGPLQLSPVSGQLKVELEKLALNDWDSYLEGIAQLEIPEGELSSSLEVSLEDKAGRVSASAKGSVQIDHLKSLDRGNARKFVEWGSLRFEGLDYSAEEIILGEVALSNAMVRVVSDAKGETNLAAIFGSTAEGGEAGVEGKPAEVASAAPGPKIRIDRIRLEDVGFAFADLAPRPNFTIDLAGLTGTVEGLSSESASRAKVNLEGRIDDAAPMRISGQINPLAGDAFTDVKVRISGVSMPTFSPYSSRFVGYAIERGKLDLDLAYKLNSKKLRAENLIDLHNFRFGRAVESPDATNLPVRLASEVLRKPNGDIQLDIPLRGNLADPSFNLLQLAYETFVNIITRIATSPFAIVGGLLPGQGDSLSQVEFEAGSSMLLPAELEDLAVLADVLVKKPELRIEIRGRADPVADEPGLRAVLGGSDAFVDADWRKLARARAKAIYDGLATDPKVEPGRLFLVDVEVGEFAGEEGRVATQLGLRVR